MPPKNTDNFFKIVALLVDIAYSVIRKYIRQNVLKSSSFESFLNQKKEKHNLIHLYETLKCCECVSEIKKGERLLARKQLLVLYKSDITKQNKSHKRYVGRQLTQVCICSYAAVTNIDVEVVDITLANLIFQTCVKSTLGLDKWVRHIKDVRNEIVHLSDIQKIKDDEFSRTWKILKESILQIANLIGSAYAMETDKKIDQTEILTFVPDHMLKYEIICHDYWRSKCAEFEVS